MLQHNVPQSCDVCIGFRLQDRIAIGLCVAVVEEREGVERLGACVCCGRAAFGITLLHYYLCCARADTEKRQLLVHPRVDPTARGTRVIHTFL